MGLVKKMEWLKWIRKYSTGILDTKTSSSMETLIDSASSKTVNYAYASSVIAADDEFINATAAAAAPLHRRQHQKQQEQKNQRPMLPPPISVTSEDSPDSPANDVYDCCVSLDGIPVRHEFQYTLSDADGCGTVTKHDIEGLASKILESVYGTTLKFSSRGQRTVKVTLNVRQATSLQSADGASPVKQLQRVSGRESKQSRHYDRTSADKTQPQYVIGGELQSTARCQIYGSGVVKGGSSSHHIRTKYRREQLIEMVQRSLAENLSFQNQRKPSKPEAIYHRPRTKRRQSSNGGSANPPSSPATPAKPVVRTPAKVGWSPYDFEPVAHVPSSYYPNYYQRQQHYYQHRQQYLNAHDERQLVKNAAKRHHQQQQLLYGGKQQTPATQAAAIGGRQHPHHQQQHRAAKKIHHHIHEHHHYHHYEHYIV